MEPRKQFNLVYGIKTAALIVLVAGLAAVLDHALMPPRQAMTLHEANFAPVASSQSPDYPLPPAELRANSGEVPPPPPSF